MKNISFTVKVPATTANLGPGFDVLGAALTLYNTLEVTVAPKGQDDGLPPVTFLLEGEGAGLLPSGGDNIVWKAMATAFDRFAPGLLEGPLARAAFHLRMVNGIPLSSGLGSSASARLAGILAAAHLCPGGKKISKEAVLALGTEMEGHPDNIVPALAGGFCVSYVPEGGTVGYVKLEPPRLKAVVCTPSFELPTVRARKVLPARYSAADVIFNTSRLAVLMAALQTGDYRLLGTGMEDRVHQPYRAHLIPGLGEVFAALRNAGASGVAVSGAGPSVIALISPSKARGAARAAEKAWKAKGIDSRSFVLDFDRDGAAIQKRKG